MAVQNFLDEHRAMISQVREISRDYRSESARLHDDDLGRKLGALESATDKLTDTLDAYLGILIFVAMTVILGYLVTFFAIGLFWSWKMALLTLGAGLFLGMARITKRAADNLKEKK